MNLKPTDKKKQIEDLGIEGLEPSQLIKSTDFPFTRNFIVVSIDM